MAHSSRKKRLWTNRVGAAAIGHTLVVRASSPLPSGLGETFSVVDAERAGVSPKRLRARDLATPFHGSRAIPLEPDASDPFESARRELIHRCRAYRTVAPPEFCFSGVTAAALYGIPLPRRIAEDQVVDVSVPVSHPLPRRRGVRGHRLTDWRVRSFLGMPLIQPAIAWAQLASWLTLDELVIAGDHLVRRKRPLETLDALTIAATGIRRGGLLARAALLDVRKGTDSPRESETRLLLVRGGLPEPIIGHTVFHDGYFVGTPDLAYVDEKIAIEYQGSVYRLDKDVFEDDIIRRELFERAGWKVILITATRLRRPASLVAEVGAVLRERFQPV
ncbi:hypothetical protein [Salinibacterium sp. CAN_S4]|uniref:hypothetical protein n=1 Tax=Salinibacterium sp. CAN_S4 TaxID=2787727 RepID=UPI0018F03395